MVGSGNRCLCFTTRKLKFRDVKLLPQVTVSGSVVTLSTNKVISAREKRHQGKPVLEEGSEQGRAWSATRPLLPSIVRERQRFPK